MANVNYTRPHGQKTTLISQPDAVIIMRTGWTRTYHYATMTDTSRRRLWALMDKMPQMVGAPHKYIWAPKTCKIDNCQNVILSGVMCQACEHDLFTTTKTRKAAPDKPTRARAVALASALADESYNVFRFAMTLLEDVSTSDVAALERVLLAASARRERLVSSGGLA